MKLQRLDLIFFIYALLLQQSYASFNLQSCLRKIKSFQIGAPLNSNYQTIDHLQSVSRISPAIKQDVTSILEEMLKKNLLDRNGVSSLISKFEELSPDQQRRLAFMLKNEDLIDDYAIRVQGINRNFYRDIEEIFIRNIIGEDLFKILQPSEIDEIFTNIKFLSEDEIVKFTSGFPELNTSTRVDLLQSLDNVFTKNTIIKKVFKHFADDDHLDQSDNIRLFNQLTSGSTNRQGDSFLEENTVVFTNHIQGGTFADQVVIKRIVGNHALVLSKSGEERIPIDSLVPPVSTTPSADLVSKHRELYVDINGEAFYVNRTSLPVDGKLKVKFNETNRELEISLNQIIAMGPPPLSLRGLVYVETPEGRQFGRVREFENGEAIIKFDNGRFESVNFGRVRAADELIPPARQKFTSNNPASTIEGLSLRLEMMTAKLDKLKKANSLDSIKDEKLISSYNQLMQEYQVALSFDGIRTKLIPSTTDPRFLNIKFIEVAPDAPINARSYMKALQKFEGNELTISLIDNINQGSWGFYQPLFGRVDIGFSALEDIFYSQRNVTATHELRHLMNAHNGNKGPRNIFHAHFYQGENVNLYGDNISSGGGSGFYDDYMSFDELYTHPSDAWELTKGGLNKFKANYVDIYRKIRGIQRLSAMSVSRITDFKRALENPSNVEFSGRGITIYDEHGRKLLIDLDRELISKIENEASASITSQVDELIASRHPDIENYDKLVENMVVASLTARNSDEHKRLTQIKAEMDELISSAKSYQEELLVEQLALPVVRQRLDAMENFAKDQNRAANDILDRMDEDPVSDMAYEELRSQIVEFGQMVRFRSSVESNLSPQANN